MPKLKQGPIAIYPPHPYKINPLKKIRVETATKTLKNSQFERTR